jgi:hypothetical protein
MANQLIYKNNNDDVVTVEQGWSWSAFFFGPFWLMVHGLWIRAIILGLLWLVTSLSIIIPLLINISIAVWGWQWRVKALDSKNFNLQTELQANNDYEAKAAFKNMANNTDENSSVTSAVAAKRLQRIKKLHDLEIISDMEFSDLREKYAAQV